MSRHELHPRTAVINKTQKNHSRKARHDALSWLCTKFPQVFDNSIRIQPLKLGIMDDILKYADEASAVGISKSKLREAVVVFTRRLDYLACLKAREMRVDLEGNPATLVTEEEAERAALKIKKRIEKTMRNNRKVQLTKTMPSYNGVRQETAKTQPAMDFSPHYPERPPAFSINHAVTPAPRAASVVVKHRTTKQYDPQAVARLKEKLGLSRRNEESKETTS